MQIQLKPDKTQFPMIFVEPLGAYIHWLPFTKIQIEYFICSTNLPDYTEDWYTEVREYNERVSPGAVTAENYWGALLTGIKPREAIQVANWLGPQVELLTDKEWNEAYQFFKRTPSHGEHIEQITSDERFSKRAKIMIRNIDESLKKTRYQPRGGHTLADQMLMRMGVMEYVYTDKQRPTFGGFGEPNTVFYGHTFSVDKGFPDRLTNPSEGAKMRHYGFRLIDRSKG